MPTGFFLLGGHDEGRGFRLQAGDTMPESERAGFFAARSLTRGPQDFVF